MATFIEGFEQFRDGDGTKLMRLAGYTLAGTVQVAGGRKGGSAIVAYRSKLIREWNFTGTLSIGVAAQFDTRGPILAIKRGSAALFLWADPDTGLLNLGETRTSGNPGYANPLKDRWYYYELVLAAGEATLYVNGKQDSQVTLPVGLTGMCTIEMNPYDMFASDYGTRSYDDFYLNDGARLQPIQVTTRFPTADGQKTDWSFVGAATRWQAVSPEIKLLDKNIYTAIDGAQNTFKSAVALPDNNPIRFLQLITLFRKATPDPMNLIFSVENQAVKETNISRDWTFRYTPMDAAGYTPANITAAEFGVKLELG